jgi:hypothetical protein
MRLFQAFCFVSLLLLTAVTDLSACRFNVRDVGFVDLGSQPYRLYCYFDSKTAAGDVTLLKDVALAAYLDCNVAAEVIAVESLGEHPAKQHFDLLKGKTLPAAVLVNALGRGLAIDLQAGNGFQEKIWDTLEAVSESPSRAKLLDQVVNRYGVLLLIEGNDAKRNQAIRSMIEASIVPVTKAITENSLEKEIKQPPTLMVLKPEDRERERVLLWSLGVGEEYEATAHVAVLYGRARQIGEVLAGDKINTSAISAILNTIGLSCECGLDRSWMQGHMIPAKWEEATQASAAKNLGFDPESPAIKMEMSQILSKSGQSRRANTFNKGNALLGGYTEISTGVVSDTDQSDQSDQSDLTNQTDVVPTSMAEPPPVAVTTESTRGRIFLMILGGLGVLVLFIGMFVFLKANGRH